MLSLPERAELQSRCQSAPFKTRPLTRAFDFVCSSAGLIFLSPLFCLIALLIKLDDGGPVFYLQDRIGKDFRRFRLCKFRSMAVGADRHGLLTAPRDSRITRVGRWLRRCKLDELPQLFNVLNGDMQLVGPRPEVGRYVDLFRAQYAALLQDRPGITDPASLAYRHEAQLLPADRTEQHYINEILPAKLKLSLDYQQQRTPISDLKVILQTLFRLTH